MAQSLLDRKEDPADQSGLDDLEDVLETTGAQSIGDLITEVTETTDYRLEKVAHLGEDTHESIPRRGDNFRQTRKRTERSAQIIEGLCGPLTRGGIRPSEYAGKSLSEPLQQLDGQSENRTDPVKHLGKARALADGLIRSSEEVAYRSCNI